MNGRDEVTATCFTLILATGLLLETLLPVSALGAEDPAELYAGGITAYGQEHYNEALAHFVEAYNLSGQPDILFNIAICNERLGDFERAMAYYEIYLDEKPAAADAETIRQRIAELETAIADGTVPPPFPATERSTERSTERAAEPDKAEEKAPTRIVRTDVQTFELLETDKANPLLWPSIGVAASGFVLVSGVITGISAIKKYNSLEGGCAPSCTDDEVSPARALAIAADVQLALGLIGAGLSTYFLIKAHRENPNNGKPQASLSLLGTGMAWELRF